MHTRRQFIKTALGCAAGMNLHTLNPIIAMAQNVQTIPIAFQLYTVRGEFARDVPGTLKKLAEIGYVAVEFWGYGGTLEVYKSYSAKALHKLLKDCGLKCCGMHIEPKALDQEHLPHTIEVNQTLGSQYLNVAAAKDKMATDSSIAQFADFLNQASDLCAKHKLTVGYHAHPFDFEKIGGHFAWELLFDRLKPELNMQMDVGNCLNGKGDPIAMLKKYPGRTKTIHIKEHADAAFDGDYYREIFHLCETTSDTKWYIVEMGGPDGKGFDVPRQALEKLRHLGK